jgi:uncharacterized protein (TIGR03437 family)
MVQVILTGTNFAKGATVNVNNPDITVSNVNMLSTTQISATFQISPNAIIGPNWGVIVTNVYANNYASSGSVTFAVNPLPVITLSTSSLAFSYIQGSALPASQNFGVLSNGATVMYSVSAANSPGGDWLALSPATGQTAGNVTVSLQNLASLSPGKYQGTVTVQPQNSSAVAQTLAVSLQISGSQPQMSLSSTDLRFSVNAGGPAVSGVIQVLNVGGGTLNYSVGSSVNPGPASWLTITCGAQGSAASSAPGSICVQLNPAGLPAATYFDSFTITTAGQSPIDVNVTMQVSSSTASILLSSTGMTFTSVSSGPIATPASQTVAVLNQGAGAMNWTAQVTGNASWLTISPTSGSSQAFGGSQPAITFTADPIGLVAGNYYAVVNVTVPDGSAGNSPAAITVLMKVLPGNGQLPPAGVSGIIFTAPAGEVAPAAQQFNLNSAMENSVLYSLAPITDDGQAWLSASPVAGSVPVGGFSPVSVQVNPAGLEAGVHYGQLRFSYSNGTEDNVDVAFLVTQPSGSQAAVQSGAEVKPQASGTCSQYGIAFVQQVPADGGTVVAGQSYSLHLKSLCVPSPPSDLNPEIDFSDGSGPLYPTFDSGSGDYEVSWTPTQAESLTFYAQSNPAGAVGMSPGATQTQPFNVMVSGPDPTGSAILDGVSNSASYTNTNEVAAGSFISIFGAQFASAPVSASGVSFPTELGGIQVTLAGTALPLYYVGAGQVNALIPFLPSQLLDSPQSLVVYRDGAPSTLNLNLLVYEPGIFSTASNGQGQGAIQNASYQLVDGSHPAHPGDTIIIYCAGLGPVANPPAAGAAASAGSTTTTMPNVYIDGIQAQVVYSGLSPGSVQLYQVNAIVPQGVNSGAVKLYLTITDPRSNAVLQSNTVTIN